MTMQELANGTVAEVSKKLPGLAAFELEELHDIEHAKANPRTTLLDAIHREQDDRKAAGENVEAPKRDAAVQAAYDKGRHARRNGIGRYQSPYSKGEMRDAYVEGWDFQDSL
tara:strand:+ start:708 stop:1043 length:336 start_codon:yes stop_codon:yes gene_type:complete